MTTRPNAAPVVPDELLRHLDEREQDAHAEVDRLRAEISELSARLEDIQQVVSRLRLTRQTLLEIAGQQDEQDQPGTAGADAADPLPPAYQEILAVFTRTDGGLRAKDLCRALNVGDRPRHVEGMRAKLKRLVGRDILTERGQR
ncbi:MULTISPECIES: hypothetical protein [unclassified Streptosporangium]|uniref:hypothetical protein n=1 Tax=unclassified Streptosporangium TaxID=2632669 RepID=UPI002E2CB74B|nr:MULTISPECIES: hypothetical protein [unclassified Streptosporangium]